MREFETKEVLLDKLIGIQDLEAVKPIHDMDTDLITECTDYIIELTGDELPSESAMEQMKLRLLQRLFGQKGRVLKYRKGVLRKLLIAAIVIILIVAMAVSMMPLGTNDESLINRLSYFFLQKEPGYSVDYDDYMTLIGDGEIKEYATTRQFIRKTHIDILVPTELPKGISVQSVKLYYEYTFNCPKISIVTNDPSSCSLSIHLGKEIEDLETAERYEKIGEYACRFSITPGWCQCEFNHNGNSYIFTAKTYNDLILIIENLKGS